MWSYLKEKKNEEKKCLFRILKKKVSVLFKGYFAEIV